MFLSFKSPLSNLPCFKLILLSFFGSCLLFFLLCLLLLFWKERFKPNHEFQLFFETRFSRDVKSWRKFKGQHDQGNRTESLWEGNLPLRGFLRGPLKTSENLLKTSEKSLKTSKNLWKPLKTLWKPSENRDPLRDPLWGRFPSQRLLVLLRQRCCPLNSSPKKYVFLVVLGGLFSFVFWGVWVLEDLGWGEVARRATSCHLTLPLLCLVLFSFWGGGGLSFGRFRARWGPKALFFGYFVVGFCCKESFLLLKKPLFKCNFF